MNVEVFVQNARKFRLNRCVQVSEFTVANTAVHRYNEERKSARLNRESDIEKRSQMDMDLKQLIIKIRLGREEGREEGRN